MCRTTRMAKLVASSQPYNSMNTMNGGQALIEALRQADICTVFGIPGAGQYEAIDALYSTPEIQYISVRNEQAATFMADGYARASGNVAAALLVPGPGLYNATAGMATAQVSSSPMLVITGSRQPSRPDYDSDELTVMKRLTKWSAPAFNVSEIPGLVQEAAVMLRSSCPAPVGLEISPKIFASVGEVQHLEHRAIEAQPLDEQMVGQAAIMLADATQPVIWVGAGVQRADASSALQQVAEYLGVPVVTSRQGKGTISDRHPLSLGFAEERYAPLGSWLAKCDLILAIGTSADLSAYRQAVVRVDADLSQVRERQRSDGALLIEGDAGQFLQALLSRLRRTVAQRPERLELATQEVCELNLQRFGPEGQLHPQWEMMLAIRNAIPDDGILVQGMNQMGYYSRNYYPVYAQRSYITSSNHATLGAAYPLALGAKIGQPARTVVALSGDGGFLYNAQEMATAVQYGINVTAIVFNDNAYGNVLRAQEEEFDGHVIGTKLHNPDFIKLAECYGIDGVLANNAEELETALRRVIQLEQPTLIEVPVGPMERVY